MASKGRGAGGRAPSKGKGGGGGGRSSPGTGGTSYSTAFSHILLAGTGTYCFTNLTGICSCVPAYQLSRSSFFIVIVNSVIGVWRFGNPLYGDCTEPIYGLTSAVQDLVLLPLIASTLMVKYDYQRDYIIDIMFVPVIPLLAYITGFVNLKNEAEKILAFFGCAGIAWLSYINTNYYGMATSVSYLMNTFFFKEAGDNSCKIPAKDLSNYAMCFFSFFALRAILD